MFHGWNPFEFNCGGIAFSPVSSTPMALSMGTGGWTAGCYGRWRYHAPGSAYVFEMDLAGMFHNSSTGMAVFYGILNGDGSSPGGGTYLNGNDPPVDSQPAAEWGALNNVARRVCTTGFDNNGALCPSSTGNAGNFAYFGLYNNVSKYYPSTQASWVYGTTLYLGDRVRPARPTFSGIPASGWVRAGSSFGVAATQGGVGLTALTVNFAAGGYSSNRLNIGCDRSYAPPYAPCPQNAGRTITVPANAEEGAGKSLSATASTYELTSFTGSRTVNIDRSGPSIAFSGSAYDRRASMPRGRYDLRVTATDGSTSSAATRRSGATRIKAVLNGQSTILDETQACPTDSCQMVRDVPIDAAPLKPGANHVEVTAYDAAGNPSPPQRFDFTVSCCAGSALDWILDLTPNQDVVFGDVNGDGAADLVTRDQTSGQVTVRPSDGEDSFGQATAWGTWPVDRSIALADYDGDGLDDLMGYVPATGALSTSASQGDSFQAPISIGIGPTGRRVLFADLDLTDTADVLLYDPATGALSSMVRAGETLEGPVDEGTLPPNHVLRVADVDRDGSGDIVAIPTQAGGDVSVRLLREDGLTAAQSWGSVPASIEADLADGDGDGRADLLVRRAGERAVDIRPSTGTSFGEPQAYGEIDADHRLASADVSGDLTDDLLGVAADGSAVSVAVSFAERLVEAAGVYQPDPTLAYDDGTDTDTEPGSGPSQFGALQQV